MANPQHLQVLKQGVDSWNRWRAEFKGRIDLSQAKLKEADLGGINLFGVLLEGADLSYAYLREANLARTQLNTANLRKANIGKADLSEATLISTDMREANLADANLRQADLSGAKLNEACLAGVSAPGANFQGAVLIKANLCDAELPSSNFCDANLASAWMIRTYLDGANLRTANLKKAWMTRATLVNSDLTGADLTGARVFGTAAWNLKLEETKQEDLIITDEDEPVVTVDNLEVAQFVHLLLNRKKLRDVIDTITSKAVLILGRFTPERKAVLDAMADELRKYNLLPIVFDFERSTTRDFSETIRILAGMSLFVIVDITNPKSAPLELQATVPDYQIPFVPIIQEDEKPFSMFRDLRKYDWVLNPVITYPSAAILIRVFKEAIIERVFQKHQELLRSKAQDISTKSAMDYLSGPISV